jgi:hypothetical protein
LFEGSLWLSPTAAAAKRRTGGATPSPSAPSSGASRGDLERWRAAAVGSARLLRSLPAAPRLLRSPPAAPRRARISVGGCHDTAAATTPLLLPFPQHGARRASTASLVAAASPTRRSLRHPDTVSCKSRHRGPRGHGEAVRQPPLRRCLPSLPFHKRRARGTVK